MIKFPEMALVCGTVLVVASHNSFGFLLISVSFITAFLKWTLEMRQRAVEQEAKGALMTNISEIIGEFLTSKGITYAPTSRDGTLH